MKIGKNFLPVALTLGALVAGCGTHTEPVAPPSAEAPARAEEFRRVWDASEDVLDRYDFPILRRDRREGVIATGLVVASQWWEFWRPPATDAAALAENTIQDIYRQATVRIRRNRDGVGYAPRVAVDVYRSEAPAIQLTSTVEAKALYNLPATEEGQGRLMLHDALDPSPGEVKVHLGEDEALARRLEGEIVERARTPRQEAPEPVEAPETPAPAPAASEDGAVVPMAPVDAPGASD